MNNKAAKPTTPAANAAYPLTRETNVRACSRVQVFACCSFVKIDIAAPQRRVFRWVAMNNIADIVATIIDRLASLSGWPTCQR